MLLPLASGSSKNSMLRFEQDQYGSGLLRLMPEPRRQQWETSPPILGAYEITLPKTARRNPMKPRISEAETCVRVRRYPAKTEHNCR
jgi:hypothetical protein